MAKSRDFATAVTAVFLVLGSSQALKAAWIEDMLAFRPPLAFLVAARIRRRAPNERFPWGYHRAVSIAYLGAALGLLLLGVYVLFESAMKLAVAEHPTIGAIEILGTPIWHGWLMLACLPTPAFPPYSSAAASWPTRRSSTTRSSSPTPR